MKKIGVTIPPLPPVSRVTDVATILRMNAAENNAESTRQRAFDGLDPRVLRSAHQPPHKAPRGTNPLLARRGKDALEGTKELFQSRAWIR